MTQVVSLYTEKGGLIQVYLMCQSASLSGGNCIRWADARRPGNAQGSWLLRYPCLFLPFRHEPISAAQIPIHTWVCSAGEVPLALRSRSPVAALWSGIAGRWALLSVGASSAVTGEDSALQRRLEEAIRCMLCDEIYTVPQSGMRGIVRMYAADAGWSEGETSHLNCNLLYTLCPLFELCFVIWMPHCMHGLSQLHQWPSLSMSIEISITFHCAYTIVTSSFVRDNCHESNQSNALLLLPVHVTLINGGKSTPLMLIDSMCCLINGNYVAAFILSKDWISSGCNVISTRAKWFICIEGMSTSMDISQYWQEKIWHWHPCNKPFSLLFSNIVTLYTIYVHAYKKKWKKNSISIQLWNRHSSLSSIPTHTPSAKSEGKWMHTNAFMKYTWSWKQMELGNLNGIHACMHTFYFIMRSACTITCWRGCHFAQKRWMNQQIKNKIELFQWMLQSQET